MPRISAFWPGLLDDHPEPHDGKPPMRTLILTLTLAIALAIGLPGKAAGTFIGPYDVANWTTTLTGNPPGGGPEAFVSTSGAPNSVTLFGGNSGCVSPSFVPCTVSFIIPAVNGGQVIFDWHYNTADIDGPFFDHFGHTLNGVFTQLTDNVMGPPSAQSGIDRFLVSTGDVFGFQLDCTDCILGAATVTIDGFAVSPVPEPGTLLLFGSSLVGLAALTRRRRSG